VQVAHVVRARLDLGQPQRRMLRRRGEQLPRGGVSALSQRVGVVPEHDQVVIDEMSLELSERLMKRRDIGIQVGHNVYPTRKKEHPEATAKLPARAGSHN